MKIVLWIYIAAFLAVVVFGLVDPDPSETQLDLVADFVLSTVTLIGLVAYAMDFRAPRLIAAWKFVAPAILIGYVMQIVVEWASLTARDPELTLAEQRVILGIALAVTALFLAPAIIVNFRLASARDAVDPSLHYS